MTVRDAGCTYVLSEIAAQTGVTLPEVTLAGNEEAEPEFVSGDTVVQTGRVFADALAQGEVRFAARASAEPPVRDPQADAGKYFRIGDTYYDNLKTALEAANEGETVTMIQGGYRYTSGGQIVVDAANVTFDGNGFDLFTNQSYAIKVLASGFTLKNIYCYSVNQLLEFNPTGEDDQLTLENVTAIANRGLLINGTRNDYKADSTATVTFRNSQLTTANNAEEVILLREKVHITLSIEGSALVNRGNSTHTYAVQSGKSDGYNRTIRVDGASTLVYSAAQKGMVIYAQSDPACTIHLAEGAVLRLEDTLAGSVFINEIRRFMTRERFTLPTPPRFGMALGFRRCCLASRPVCSAMRWREQAWWAAATPTPMPSTMRLSAQWATTPLILSCWTAPPSARRIRMAFVLPHRFRMSCTGSCWTLTKMSSSA